MAFTLSSLKSDQSIQAWAYSQKTNPYGYLTDAWNMIKKPYLSRSSQIFGMTNTQPLPTCGDHYMCLSLDNWMGFTDCVENYAHENVHQLLGGVTHSEHTLERLVGQYPQFRKLYLWLASRADRAIMTLHSKQVMDCPEYCAVDVPFSECKCSCPSLESAGSIDQDTLSYLKDDLGVFTFLSYYQGTEEGSTPTISNRSSILDATASFEVADIESISEMMMFYCNPGMIGDQYTSYATNDPSFWPIHPTLERLWHLKRLAGNETFDDTWEDVSGCLGHNAHDVQPFQQLIGEKSQHHYSNKDLYDLLDPRNPDLPDVFTQSFSDHAQNIFLAPRLSSAASRRPAQPRRLTLTTSEPELALGVLEVSELSRPTGEPVLVLCTTLTLWRTTARTRTRTRTEERVRRKDHRKARTPTKWRRTLNLLPRPRKR